MKHPTYLLVKTLPCYISTKDADTTKPDFRKTSLFYSWSKIQFEVLNSVVSDQEKKNAI